MDQIIVYQRRKLNGSYQWRELDLFSTSPFRWVTACSWKASVMADDYISITLISEEYVTFAVGDYCIINGRKYSIRSMADIVRSGEERWEYNIVMYGVMYDMIGRTFRNCDINGTSSTSSFDLTYTLEEFVKVVVNNMNRETASGVEEWKCGNGESGQDWPVTDPITMSFQRINCLTALQNICNEFDYEFRVSQAFENGVCIKTITVGKFDTTPHNSTPFSYGKGDGLYQLKECKVDDSTIVNRLWVEGGTENVRSSYRNYAQFLQLPFRRLNKNAHTFDDGTSVQPRSQRIGITEDGKRYIEDAESIQRYGVIEDSWQTDEIFPHFTGEVAGFGTDHRLQFHANIGFDLNAKWAKEWTANFQSDFQEWCYINGYYQNNEDNYARFCSLNGYNYTDYETCRSAFDEYSSLTLAQFNEIKAESGFVNDFLVFYKLNPTLPTGFAGWEELLMNGLIYHRGGQYAQCASYTAFEVKTGEAYNAYVTVSNAGQTKYLIDSNTCAKIVFIDGKLAGQQFDVANFTQRTIIDTTYGVFTINEITDETGTVMPSTDSTPGEPFRFAVGDHFKIVDIFLPYTYYEDAEEELWYAGQEKLSDVCQASYRYELTFDQIFIGENEEFVDSLLPGMYIKIADERFFSELTNYTKSMRITNIDKDLLGSNQLRLTLENVHKLRRRKVGNNWAVADITDVFEAVKKFDTKDLIRTQEPAPFVPRRFILGGSSTIIPARIGNESIAERMIEPGAVTTSKMADGAVSTDKISNNAVTLSKVEKSVAFPREILTAEIECLSDKIVVGEGFYYNSILGEIPIEEVAINKDVNGNPITAGKQYNIYVEVDSKSIVVSDADEDMDADKYFEIGAMSEANSDNERIVELKPKRLAPISATRIRGGSLQDNNGRKLVDLENAVLSFVRVSGGVATIVPVADIDAIVGKDANSGLRFSVGDLIEKVGEDASDTGGLLYQVSQLDSYARSTLRAKINELIDTTYSANRILLSIQANFNTMRSQLLNRSLINQHTDIGTVNELGIGSCVWNPIQQVEQCVVDPEGIGIPNRLS